MGNNFFVMDAAKNIKEYLDIGDSLKIIDQFCQRSEFQFLNKKMITIEVTEDSGRVCQDFIYSHGIPLISERLKEFFDEYGIDYLFYKKVLLRKSSVGMEEVYWLALPERIKCLNVEESEIDEFLNIAEKIVINPDRVGRYEIFKLAEVGNLQIIISEKLANKIKNENFIGIHIYNLC